MKKYLLILVLLTSLVNNAQSQVVYNLSTCAYSPIAGSGTALPNCDDCMSGMVPIGFTFSFYGINYTTCDISSNGFLTFNAGMGNGCCSGQAIPVATWPTMIAWAWDDMYTVGATVNYFTTGVAPNRIFVINYNSVGFCCSVSNQATVQIQLYETTNEIRILSANNNHSGRTATMGIQSIGNGNLVVPGRNSTSWVAAANECQSFNPGPCTPTADFSANITNACIGAPINFTDLSTCIPTSWSWSFPGGVPATSTSQNPTVSYAAAGVYNVTLTATNAFGSDSEVKNGYITIINTVADFTASSTVICANGSVTFNDISTCTPTSWSWSFPGGVPATSTAQNPTVSYAAIGNYNVTLTATSASGSDSEVKNGYISVVDCSAGCIGGNYYYVRSQNGGSPWGSNTNELAMNDVFGAGVWTQAYFETVNPATLFAPTTCSIFMDGSDAGADEMEAFLAANTPAMEAWVTTGGRIFLNTAPNEGNGMSYGFAGVNLDFDISYVVPPLTATGNSVLPGHAIFNGPFLPVGLSWTGNWFAHSEVSGNYGTSLIEGTGAAAGVVNVATKTWGVGLAVFGTMTTTNWHTPALEAYNLRKNILCYISPPIICGPPAPLPVVLNLFNGTCTNIGTTLYWSTTSETNSAEFIIESSVDGINYIQDGKVSAAGNSNQLLEYSYISNLRSSPGNYFRLKQIDFDGKEKIYGPIYVDCDPSNNTNCVVLNVIDDLIELDIYSAQAEEITCTLLDVRGRILETLFVNTSKGANTIKMNAHGLPNGVYIVMVAGTNHQCASKFLKQ